MPIINGDDRIHCQRLIECKLADKQKNKSKLWRIQEQQKNNKNMSIKTNKGIEWWSDYDIDHNLNKTRWISEIN